MSVYYNDIFTHIQKNNIKWFQSNNILENEDKYLCYFNYAIKNKKNEIAEILFSKYPDVIFKNNNEVIYNLLLNNELTILKIIFNWLAISKPNKIYDIHNNKTYLDCVYPLYHNNKDYNNICCLLINYGVKVTNEEEFRMMCPDIIDYYYSMQFKYKIIKKEIT